MTTTTTFARAGVSTLPAPSRSPAGTAATAHEQLTLRLGGTVHFLLPWRNTP